MNSILTSLCCPRVRISVLLTVSVLAILFCCINLPIVYVGLIELAALSFCIVLFRKIDVTQYEFFQFKPHLFWLICEWYWTLWFCFNYLLLRLITQYPSLCRSNDGIEKAFKSFPAISGHVLNLSYVISISIIVLTIPVCFYLFRWLLKQISVLFQSITTFEKYFFVISSSILILVLLIISSKTSFFIYPIHANNYLQEESGKIIMKYYDFNVFFNTDTFLFFELPMYSWFRDSFRHPLFSIAFQFFMPMISALQYGLNIFFKSPCYSFVLSAGIVQIFLYVYSAILIGKLFEQFTSAGFNRFLSIFYVCSFPVVFCFVPERLIFSSFFLICSIYIICNLKSFTSRIFPFIISCGTIGCTSLSVIPVAFSYFIQKRIKDIILLIIFLFVILFFRNNLGLNKTLNNCADFSLFNSIINNYNQFLSSNLVVPNWETMDYKLSHLIDSGVSADDCISIWLKQKSCIRDTVIGIIIVCLCFLSITHYYRQPIVLISGFWFLVSIGIIGIAGFGSSECVLYCSYFSWAIIPLTLLPFYWLWQKFPRLPIPQALYLFAAYLAISNLYFLYQVVQVVSERYIVPPGM